MQMFPFRAARLKADILRAACNDVGMHTPTHWQRVVVSVSFPPLPQLVLCSIATSREVCGLWDRTLPWDVLY